jgi:hypothetical protein
LRRPSPAAPRPVPSGRNTLEGWELKAEADADRLATLRDDALEQIGEALTDAVADGLENLAAIVAGRVGDGKTAPDQTVDVGNHVALIRTIADGHLAAYNQAGLDVRGILGGDVTPLSAADVDLSELLATLEATSRETVAKTIAELVEEAEAARPATKARDWSALAERMLARLSGHWAPRAKAIGLTEAVAAYNRGWLDAYAEAGHGELVRVTDGDYDRPCAEANGKLWSVRYARSHPSQHPNCRRRFGPPKQVPEPKAPDAQVRTLEDRAHVST